MPAAVACAIWQVREHIGLQPGGLVDKLCRGMGFPPMPSSMKPFLKRLASSPAFIATVALAVRLVILWWTWHRAAPADANEPYGFEMGHVAQSIASGRGFSSPLNLVTTGPTAWLSPAFPLFVAGVFKIWGVFSTRSLFIIKAFNCFL